MGMRTWTTIVLAGVTLCGSAAPTSAQTGPFRKLFTTIGHDAKSVSTGPSLTILGLGTIMTLAVHTSDQRLTDEAVNSDGLADTVDSWASTLGGGWVQGSAAVITYLAGKATHKPRLTAVGGDLVEAQIFGALVTHGLKFAVNRTRPDGDRYSFPSGHTSATFATAAVLQRHFGWKVGVPAYGVAALVGASRMQANRHYPSDIVFGATVGILAGRAATLEIRHSKLVVSPALLPGGIGVAIEKRR
jgi:hypothetical protein